MSAREALRERLLGLGFDAVRFVRSGPLPEGPLRDWLAQGRHGTMAWLERNVEKRVDPGVLLPGTASLILLGVNYGLPESASVGRPGGPVWARYSLHADYHDTLKPALAAAGRIVEDVTGLGPDDYRYYVDTGPVLERAWADRAGLGFVGKNAMLISREFGNWLFLACLLVRADWEPDAPLRRPVERSERVGALCGKCTRCLDTCPTGALVEPGVLDARRCLSYLTIENKGPIPRKWRRAVGGRIYGCDICAEVCPWNRFAQTSRRLLLTSRYDLADLTLETLLTLEPDSFTRIFRGTAIKRIKLAGLLRNACVVAANLGATDCLPHLVRLASHPAPLVRAHAVWAVRELAPVAAAGLLATARAAESDPLVMAEYEAA